MNATAKRYYGQHTSACMGNEGEACNCGYEAIHDATIENGCHHPYVHWSDYREARICNWCGSAVDGSVKHEP